MVQKCNIFLLLNLYFKTIQLSYNTKILNVSGNFFYYWTCILRLHLSYKTTILNVWGNFFYYSFTLRLQLCLSYKTKILNVSYRALWAFIITLFFLHCSTFSWGARGRAREGSGRTSEDGTQARRTCEESKTAAEQDTTEEKSRSVLFLF